MQLEKNSRELNNLKELLKNKLIIKLALSNAGTKYRWENRRGEAKNHIFNALPQNKGGMTWNG